ALADEAVGKTRLGENPTTFEAGTYPVILDPYAAADLLEMLAEGISGLAFQCLLIMKACPGSRLPSWSAELREIPFMTRCRAAAWENPPRVTQRCHRL